MAGRPGTLPWNMATFTGANPVTTLSDNFNFLNSQINDSGAGFTTFGLDIGTPNNLVVNLASAPVAYEPGMMLCVKPANSNTGTAVINVNSLGNQSIVNGSGLALSGGEIPSTGTTTLVYDGTNFRIVGSCILGAALVGLSGNQFVNCSGYTAVTLRMAWSSGSTGLLVLQRIGKGVPINLSVANSTGGGFTFTMNASNPDAGTVTSIVAYNMGTTNGAAGIDMIATGVSISNNFVMSFTGGLISPTFMSLAK